MKYRLKTPNIDNVKNKHIDCNLKKNIIKRRIFFNMIAFAINNIIFIISFTSHNNERVEHKYK